MQAEKEAWTQEVAAAKLSEVLGRVVNKDHVRSFCRSLGRHWPAIARKRGDNVQKAPWRIGKLTYSCLRLLDALEILTVAIASGKGVTNEDLRSIEKVLKQVDREALEAIYHREGKRPESAEPSEPSPNGSDIASAALRSPEALGAGRDSRSWSATKAGPR